MIFQNFKKISFLGNVGFLTVAFFAMGDLALVEASAGERYKCAVNWNLYTCQPANFSPPGKTAIEIAAEERTAFLRAEAKRRATAWPTAFIKISKDMKNPNSVRIPFDQAPGISAKTDQLNGRRVCDGSFKTGKKSKQDKDVHIDRECCLDKDEIPNPRCYYPQLGAQNSPERMTTSKGKKVVK